MIKNIYWLNEYAITHQKAYVVELPLHITGNDIDGVIVKRYEEFVRLIKEYDIYTGHPEPDEINEIIKYICQLKDCFLCVVRNGLKDYQKLEEVLWDIDKKYAIFHLLKETFDSKILYRIRTDNPQLYEEKDFYHCPIHKNRSKNRFGDPNNCMWYLGLSEKVCKYEARGIISSMASFMRDDSANPLSVIDLTQNGLFSKERPELDRKCYLFFWLLVCCYCVADNDSQDSMTYIFPQLLSHFIKKNFHDIDGIKYYTVRNEKLNPDETTFVNLALFTRNYDDDGYDMNVCSKFKMVETFQNLKTEIL